MAAGLYVRPLGLLYGEAALVAIEAGKAGPLAGSAIAFSQAQIITGAPGSAVSEIRGFENIKESDEPALGAALENISAPRSPVAGLSLDTPRIMGVVNVTPDSFSDGGLYDEADRAIARAAELAIAGADIVDIGGESTRPGAERVEAEVEIARILPVIEGLGGNPARISVDTRRASVMRAALGAGADILNDVSALTHDSESLELAAAADTPIVLMHAKGEPKTMQSDPVYRDALLEVYDYLSERIAACEEAGIPRDRLIADPGIGFGKTLEHNLQLISGLGLFHGLGVSVLLGASRKRFIGALTGEPDPRKREPGSLAAALAGARQGVQILRVHDVAATRQALRVWGAVHGGVA